MEGGLQPARGLQPRLLCLFLFLTLFASGNAPTEYELKAAYLFNILRFAEPRAARSAEFITLGLHAAGPIERALRAMEGAAVRGRKLRLKTVDEAADLRDCDAVFLGRSTGPSVRLLSRAASAGILTVGNDAAFVPMGGMMALVVESRTIVVEINEPALSSAGWVLSSYLLEVARTVKGGAR